MNSESVEVSIVVCPHRGAYRIAVTGEVDMFSADAMREALTSVAACTRVGWSWI